MNPNPDIESLINILRNEMERYLWFQAVKELGEIGSPAIEPLIALIQSGDLFERCIAIETLGGIDDSRVLDPIITALNDDEKLVRKEAAKYIGKIGNETCVKPLLELLKDSERDLQWEASVALGNLKKVGIDIPDIKVSDEKEVNEKGFHLESAIEHSKYETIQSLINQGLDVNTKSYGTPALHIAVNNKKEAIFTLLLDLGADISLTDKNGNTALHIAAIGDDKILNMLIKRGADLNARNIKGQTALFDASVFGYLGNMRDLISSGANVNLEDHWGNTALFYGIARVEIVKLLIENGAFVNKKNKKGVSALEEAIMKAEKYKTAERQNVVAIISGNELKEIKGWKVTEKWEDWNLASKEVAKHRNRIREARKTLVKDMLDSGSFPFGGFIVYSKKESAETIGGLLEKAGCPLTNISQVQYNPESNEWEKIDN